MKNSWNNNCDDFHLKTVIKSEYFFVNFKMQTNNLQLEFAKCNYTIYIPLVEFYFIFSESFLITFNLRVDQVNNDQVVL